MFETPKHFEVPMFSPSLEDLRQLTSSKWSRFSDDILPAFIAEMDFTTAQPIQQMIGEISGLSDYGYPRHRGKPLDKALASTFASRMNRRFHWDADPELVLPAVDIVQATMACILAFSNPGDGVIVQLPCYPPFRGCIQDSGRRLQPLWMRDDATGYKCDIEGLEVDGKPVSRLFILCNPQNPTGRVFNRSELESFADYVLRNDLIVISDEIHADLLFDGREHIPFASLSPEMAARTITLTSATKSFNIPGLRCAVIHFGSPSLKNRFETKIPARVLGQPNVFGTKATIAAWEYGDAWLGAVIEHLSHARYIVRDKLKQALPDIKYRPPEGTYLAWLDCRGLNIRGSAAEFFLKEARVAMSEGETFDPSCPGFVRLNFATSHTILETIIDRMAAAI